MIITLCGSTKFEEAYYYWDEKLSIEHGHIVFSLSVFPSQKTEREWYTKAVKNTLDLIHLQKISNSDAIFVITAWESPNNPYIGESTAREIEWAKLNEKIVFYDHKWEK